MDATARAIQGGDRMDKIVMMIVLAIWYIYGLWEMKR